MSQETVKARFIAEDGISPEHIAMEPAETMIGFADRAAAISVGTSTFYALSRVEVSGHKNEVLTHLVAIAISGHKNRASN